MDQQAALQNIVSTFKAADPASYEKVSTAIEQSLTSFDYSKVVQVGSTLPSFRLQDATGSSVSSADLLSRGALLLAFYRGSWCPYCNIAVQYLQRHLAAFSARGVTLVAVTPEKPDSSLSLAEKHGLGFPVLTDLGNGLARRLGIVYDQGWAREFHAKRGIDLRERNGDDSWEVPVPATLLVDGEGTVRRVYVEADFRERLDPKVALEWIDEMNG